jgi:hypothetical protein
MEEGMRGKLASKTAPTHPSFPRPLFPSSPLPLIPSFAANGYDRGG